MSNLAEFRINMGDLTEPELSDASKPAVDPSSLGFVIQNAQNAALIGMDGGGVAGADLRGGALAQQSSSAAEKREREKKESRDTFMLLALLNRINALESDLAAKYGENFAEDMFADLHQQGLIDQEDYDRILAINDQNERRQAIALRTQQGLDDGTITDADLAKHPWDVKEWMDPRVEAQGLVSATNDKVQRGDLDISTVENDVKNKALLTNTFNPTASPENIALTNEAQIALEADRKIDEAKPFQLSFPGA